jgi:Fe-S-cluster-containing dehydrogenase component/DMSO reductase anchor subunit
LSEAPAADHATVIDLLLAEQRSLTAVERFSRAHDQGQVTAAEKHYRRLLPATPPRPGQQYAFEVDLDKCSGCKACVTACHSLNGLDEDETWRSVGLLVSDPRPPAASRVAFQQHVTTACHHCADPGCANGCPVLAYDKDPVTGIVRHLDDQCIGCSYCVMKCPYEVPKYSRRRGIVRKCDMCSQRLAVGEAPACVQACPDEAIRITLVSPSEVRETHRGSPVMNPAGKDGCGGAGEAHRNGGGPAASVDRFNLAAAFLPDSPDPRITLPTTRFISAKLPADLVAADHAVPRLDHAHWPLVLMLVLTQAAAGLFVAAAVGATMGASAQVWPLVGFITLSLGLTASVLHLGQPLKAWRAFLGWRKSWLSREIIAFNAFAGVALLAVGAAWLPPLRAWQSASGCFAAAIGLGAVFVSAMVYVDTHRPPWCARITFGNFFGTTLLLGATIAAAGFGWLGHAQLAQAFALVAVLLGAGLFGWWRLAIHAAARDVTHPRHLSSRVIRELIPVTLRSRTRLFIASTVFGLLAALEVGQVAPVWASLAALTTFASEIIGRYIFFVAGAAKRMPGGLAA